METELRMASGFLSNHVQMSCAFLFTVRVVEVHALVALFNEHRLHLLRSIDAVIENQCLRSFCFLLIRIEQLSPASGNCHRAVLNY